MNVKNRLDREQVLAVAGEIADRDGLQAVTLARVAAALDIKPPSLYSHIDSLAGLLDALSVETLAELADRLREAALGRSGADALRALASAYRGYAHEHPGRYQTILKAPGVDQQPLARQADRTIAVFAAVLRAWELDDEQVIHAVRTLRAALHGFVTIELAGGFGLPVDREVSFAEMVETLVAGLRQRARPNAPKPVATSADG